MCLAKSVKPNSVQRKRHQMALFKIKITTLDMTKFSVYTFSHSYAPNLTLISKDGCTHSLPQVSYDSQLLNLTLYQPTAHTYHLEQIKKKKIL